MPKKTPKNQNKEKFNPQKLLYQAQTLAKSSDGGDSADNQDAISTDLSNNEAGIYRAALSDGAGGVGVFCGEWAKHLVSHCPSLPLATLDALDNWITVIYEPFYEQWKKVVEEERTFLKDKFYLQGSAATLVAFWLDTQQSTDVFKIHLLSYGDSFYYLRQGEQVQLPPQRSSIEQYQQNPCLLNWKDEKSPEKGFSYRCYDLAKDQAFRLILCSDAVGQCLLSHYQKQDDNIIALSQGVYAYNQQLSNCLNSPYSVEVLIENMQTAMHSAVTFQDFCHSLYQQNYLLRDDYSVIMLSYTPLTLNADRV